MIAFPDAEGDGAAPRLALAAWSSGPQALWLVRHGQSEGNVVRDDAERQEAMDFVLGCRDADVPLSDLGRRQAAALGTWLAEQPSHLHPDAVLVSPYLRAAQTADLLLEAAGLQHLPRGVDERLRDREMGEWDGLTWRGIVAHHPEEAERAKVVGRYFHRPPGGESWADIALRLRTLLADAARELPGARLLVVAHDVVIQLTRALIEGFDERATVELVTTTAYANCGLTIFERDDGGPPGSTATTGRFPCASRASPRRGVRMPPSAADPPEAARVVTPALLRDWPLPPPGEDKGARGSVLVAGGAADTPGAALLAGLAALRAGAGKLQLAVAAPVAPALAVAVPEALVRSLRHTASGSVRAGAVAELADLLEKATSSVPAPASTTETRPPGSSPPSPRRSPRRPGSCSTPTPSVRSRPGPRW